MGGPGGGGGEEDMVSLERSAAAKLVVDGFRVTSSSLGPMKVKGSRLVVLQVRLKGLPMRGAGGGEDGRGEGEVAFAGRGGRMASELRGSR